MADVGSFDGTLEGGLSAAQAALNRGDLDGGLAIFARLREAFPNAVEPYQSAAFALLVAQRFDEADALLLTARARFPDLSGLAIDFAWVAHRRRDTAEAERRWADVRRLFPDHPLGVTGASVTLRESGQFDAAKAMLARGEARFGQEPAFIVECASLAQACGDLPEAIARWADVRVRMPDFWPAFTGGASALRDAHRFDEAEALLVVAINRFPTLPQPLTEMAQLATSRRDWVRATEAWGRVVALFPERIDGYIGQARASREQGRLADCEQTLRAAVDRFSGRAELWIDLAWAVTHQNRHDDAADIWAKIRKRFPSFITGYTGGAVALGNGGRPDEAMALLDRAEQLFPGDPGPSTERGWLAINGSEFAIAEQIFGAAQARFPDYPVAPFGLARALRAQGKSTEALAILAEAVTRFPTFELLSNDFVALGGDLTTVAPRPEIARPSIVPDRPIRIAVAGYHLANQIAQILARLAPLKDRAVVEWLNFGAEVDVTRAKLPFGWLEAADLYIEEGQPGPAHVKNGLRTLLSGDCVVRTMPTSGCRSLWPFDGRDPRLIPEPPNYPGGRYSHTDRIAASLAGSDMTDDALFDAYLAMTEAEELDLDALYAGDLAQWRADDAACDITLAPFIDAQFRIRPLFATPHERCAPIVREIARQVLGLPLLADVVGQDEAAATLDRLLLGWTASHHGLPVHPRVARHFRLEWWSPNRHYREMGNEFTFRDYILRYIRWSPWLS